MGKENITYIYIGIETTSVGKGYMEDFKFYFKPESSKLFDMFKKPIAIFRSKDVFEHLTLDLKVLDPTTNELTGEIIRYVFYDLEHKQEFNFKDATPLHMKLLVEALKCKVIAYQNAFQNLQDLVERSSINDFERKEFLKQVKFARDAVGGGYNGQAQQQNTAR